MLLANSIIDTLIYYTEFMTLFLFIAATVLHIDKYLDKVQMKERSSSHEQKQLAGTPERKQLAPVKQLCLPAAMTPVAHAIMPMTLQTHWTVKQLRVYLKEKGHKRISKLCKSQLMQLVKDGKHD